MSTNVTAKKVFSLLRIMFGLALVALALANLDWSRLSAIFRSVEIPWLAAGILSVVVSLGLKVARWAWLVRVCGPTLDWLIVLRAFFAGQAANIIFPFRGGEAVRAGIAWADQKSTDPAVVISILLEKYLDLLFLFIAALLTILWLPAGQVEWVRSILALLVTLATTLLVMMILGGGWVWMQITSRLPARIRQSKPVRWLSSAMQGLSQLRSLKKGAGGLAFTTLIWIFMALTNLLFFQSIRLAAGPPEALLVVVAVYIGMIPALMPGNVGPFYLAVQLALQPFQVPAESSAAFAILLHAVVTMTPLLIAGLVYLLPTHKPLGSEVS